MIHRVSNLNLDQSPFSGLDRLSHRLGYHADRQKMIAANLANIDTPGYRPRDIVFHETLQAQAKNGSFERSMSQGQEIVVQDDEPADQDGNSVSLEKQMSKTMANSLQYNTLAALLSRKIGMLKYAANDGR